MNVEDRIKRLLGEQIVQLVSLGVQLEDLKKKIAELEAKLPKDESK